MVSGIVRELESRGESEISSEEIGELVMEQLRELDDVAYVRFASVYRNFREAKDFEAVLGELSGDEDAPAAANADDLPHPGRPFRRSRAASGDRRSCSGAGARPPRLGRTWPNPAVGAVIVKDGVVVGRGWTQPGGRPHAETEALSAPARRRAARRSTSRSSRARTTARRRPAPTPSSRPASPAWSRRWRTPIRRSRAGATRGCAPPASRSTSAWAPRKRARAHAGHIRRIRDGRPHVILKLAVSADGKAALAGRRPVAITGEAARRACICCARSTTRSWSASAPCWPTIRMLTCRLPGMEARSPVRVVLDRELRMPLDERLVATARGDAALGRRRGDAPKPRGQRCAQAPRCCRCPRRCDGRLDLAAVCKLLAGRGITRLMVEGGPTSRRRWSTPIWSTSLRCCAGPNRSAPTASTRSTAAAHGADAVAARLESRAARSSAPTLVETLGGA